MRHKKLIQIISLSIASLLPAVALAQQQVQQGLLGIRALFPFTGVAGSQTLTGSNGLIANVIRLLLLVAGALAVVFVIYGGYQYITAGGNEEQAEGGKKTLVNAIIGVVVIILSYVIINVVINTIAGTGGIFG